MMKFLIFIINMCCIGILISFTSKIPFIGIFNKTIIYTNIAIIISMMFVNLSIWCSMTKNKR